MSACSGGGGAGAAGPYNATTQAGDLYASDDFRINCYKILPCPQRSTHTWSLCPFAHANERLRRRPLYREDRPGPLYRADLCPAVRAHQECPMGRECGFAHNVFEHWLHPSMYRTRLCTSGAACTRAMCFFAHSRDELRVAAPSSPTAPLPALLAPPSEGSSRGHSSETLPLVAVSALAAAQAAAVAGGGPGSEIAGSTAWERTLAALGLAPQDPLPPLAGECGTAPHALSALALGGALPPAAPLPMAAGQWMVPWGGGALTNRRSSLLTPIAPLAVEQAPAPPALLAESPVPMAVVSAGSGAGAAAVHGFAALSGTVPQPVPQCAVVMHPQPHAQPQLQPLVMVPVGSLTEGDQSVPDQLIYLMH